MFIRFDNGGVKRKESSGFLLVGRRAHHRMRGPVDDAAESESNKPAAAVDEKVDGGEQHGLEAPLHSDAEEPAVEPAEPVVLADSLQIPWSIEIFENTFYLTERPGSIVKIENGTVERQRAKLRKELSADSACKDGVEMIKRR